MLHSLMTRIRSLYAPQLSNHAAVQSASITRSAFMTLPAFRNEWERYQPGPMICETPSLTTNWMPVARRELAARRAHLNQAILENLRIKDKSSWLRELSNQSAQRLLTTRTWRLTQLEEETLQHQTARRCTRRISELLHSYTFEFNSSISVELQLSITEPEDISEILSMHRPRDSYYRFRVSSKSWSLVIRCKGIEIECFLMDTPSVIGLCKREADFEPFLILQVTDKNNLTTSHVSRKYIRDGNVSLSYTFCELKFIARDLFHEVIARTLNEICDSSGTSYEENATLASKAQENFPLASSENSFDFSDNAATLFGKSPGLSAATSNNENEWRQDRDAALSDSPRLELREPTKSLEENSSIYNWCHTVDLQEVLQICAPAELAPSADLPTGSLYPPYNDLDFEITTGTPENPDEGTGFCSIGVAFIPSIEGGNGAVEQGAMMEMQSGCTGNGALPVAVISSVKARDVGVVPQADVLRLKDDQSQGYSDIRHHVSPQNELVLKRPYGDFVLKFLANLQRFAISKDAIKTDPLEVVS